jgi:hypothetical protein
MFNVQFEKDLLSFFLKKQQNSRWNKYSMNKNNIIKLIFKLNSGFSSMNHSKFDLQQKKKLKVYQ